LDVAVNGVQLLQEGFALKLATGADHVTGTEVGPSAGDGTHLPEPSTRILQVVAGSLRRCQGPVEDLPLEPSFQEKGNPASVSEIGLDFIARQLHGSLKVVQVPFQKA
jgi:hypothetical protein